MFDNPWPPVFVMVALSLSACNAPSGSLDGGGIGDGGPADSEPAPADIGTVDWGRVDSGPVDGGVEPADSGPVDGGIEDPLDGGAEDVGRQDGGLARHPWSPCLGPPVGPPGFTAIASPPQVAANLQGALQSNGEVVLSAGTTPPGPLGGGAIFDPVTLTFRDGPSTGVNGPTYVAPGGYMMVRATATAEYYDPASRRWVRTSEAPTGTHGGTLTRLADGRWLSVGGLSGGLPSDIIEIYDPAPDAWRELGRLSRPRIGAAVVELAPGRILIAGHSFRNQRDRSSEWLDLNNGQTSPGPNLVTEIGAGIATQLLDGRILFSQELGSTSEIYDPKTDSFTLLSTTPYDAVGPSTVLLCDGRVLRVGGRSSGGMAAAWYFDPQTDEWNASSDAIAATHQFGAATLLADGSVLVVGGSQVGNNSSPRAFRFVPSP